MSEALWVAIVGAVGVVLGTLFASLKDYLVQKGRQPSQNLADEAAAADKISTAWEKLLDERKEQIDQCIERTGQLSHEIATARERDARRSQILQHSIARIATLEQATRAWMMEREEWKAGIVILVNQLRRLEIKPDWTPGTAPFQRKDEESKPDA